MSALSAKWRRQGHELGFGIGIAQGEALVGNVGSPRKMDFTAIGDVTNIAANDRQNRRAGPSTRARRRPGASAPG